MADSDRADPSRAWVCVGVLSGAHGVRGDVRVKPFTEDARTLAQFETLHRGPGGPAMGLTVLREIKGGLAVRIDGVTDREAAQALSGVKLFVPRSALPAPEEADEYYLTDLVGLAVITPDGRPVGRVEAVPNYGAGDLVEVRLDHPVKGFGRSALIPFERAWVPEVDLAGGTVTVDLDGWLARQEGGGSDGTTGEA